VLKSGKRGSKLSGELALLARFATAKGRCLCGAAWHRLNTGNGIPCCGSGVASQGVPSIRESCDASARWQEKEHAVFDRLSSTSRHSLRHQYPSCTTDIILEPRGVISKTLKHHCTLVY